MFFIILAGLIVYGSGARLKLPYVGALRAASVDASSNETQAAALDSHGALEHGVINQP